MKNYGGDAPRPDLSPTADLPHEPLEAAPARVRKASERLRDCSHFVALLADQLEALEQEDFPRLRELDAMRAKLAEEMRAETDGEIPLLEWVAMQVEEAVVGVESWTEFQRRSSDELSQLQDESLPLVRGIRRLGGGNYLPLEPASTQLDVRL
jgi:broad specificity phosphatase PhoE